MASAPNQKLVEINRVVRAMANGPERRLPLSRKALELLREIPRNGNGAEVTAGAGSIREVLRGICSDPARMTEAGEIAAAYTGFMDSRKIPDSVH